MAYIRLSGTGNAFGWCRDGKITAGGLTPNGRRDEVLLIRKEGASVTQYRFSLADNSLFSSPCYWLHRDDVIIIAPRHSRKVNE